MYLCTRIKAQMAESVDALVSNTSGATRAGSTPALGTSLKSQSLVSQMLARDFCCPDAKELPITIERCISGPEAIFVWQGLTIAVVRVS